MVEYVSRSLCVHCAGFEWYARTTRPQGIDMFYILTSQNFWRVILGNML